MFTRHKVSPGKGIFPRTARKDGTCSSLECQRESGGRDSSDMGQNLARCQRETKMLCINMSIGTKVQTPHRCREASEQSLTVGVLDRNVSPLHPKKTRCRTEDRTCKRWREKRADRHLTGQAKPSNFCRSKGGQLISKRWRRLVMSPWRISTEMMS